MNKALNNFEDTVVLSEVNPINEISDRAARNPISTIAEQAKQWYGIELRSKGFTEQIYELELWCTRNKRHLIIRDWTFIDFTPHKLNNYNPPNSSSTIDILEGRMEIRKVAFIRDSIDVYLSRNISLNEFYNSYINYVNYLIKNNIVLFKYEDFCDDYSTVLESITKFLELPKLKYIDCSIRNSKLTGDTNISRGNQYSGVIKLKRKYVNPLQRRSINKSELMVTSNTLFSYPTTYESIVRESFFEHLFFKIKRKMKNISNRRYRLFKNE